MWYEKQNVETLKVNLPRLIDAERGKCKVQHDMNSCVYWVIPLSDGEDRNLFELCENLNFLVRVDS